MKKRPVRVGTAASANVAGIVLRAAAPLWLVPAFAINLDWGPSGALAWNLSAGFSIVATAVIFEAARHQERGLMLAILALFGALLICANIANGFRNAVTRSGDCGRSFPNSWGRSCLR